MDTTVNLALPYIMANQAQKHVTHNDAIRAIDAVVQLSVIDLSLPAPPLAPNDGDRYIVAANATGAWSGKETNIAAWQDGAWMFYEPNEGWLTWVADEDQLYVWDNQDWTQISGTNSNSGGNLQNVPLLGVNTTADATNKLAVSSSATLLNHTGAGHQLKINKSATGESASLLFQTGLSGRAEFGTTGDDDWHVKVSADGSNWKETLVADGSSAAIRFPGGLEHDQSRAPIGQFLITPGGDGEVSFYRINVSRGQNPRSATISAISADTITLTTAKAGAIFDDQRMNGVCFVRIWNMSKNPSQQAWVKASPATNKLTITNAGDISGWNNSDTIQVGDPTTITPNRCIALDISPMLQNVLGAEFRQTGILCNAAIFPPAGYAQSIGITPTGNIGTFNNVGSTSDGSVGRGMLFISCTQQSPISNSNLVFVRESDVGGTLGITLMSSLAVIA